MLKQIASSIDRRLDRIDQRFDRMEERMWSNFLWLLGTGIAPFGALFAAMGHGFHWW